MYRNKTLFLISFLALTIPCTEACTVFSARDSQGHVWAGNNEDMYFTFKTYLNLVAGTDSTFGYMYFSYFEPGANMQGGVNEAGLFYDGNAVKPSVYKDFDQKRDYPGGSRLIFQYAMQKCKTVLEVFELFKQYRLSGLESAQIHLADRFGNFGIIVADSMWITNSDHQVSTNYNLCHPDKDGINCWRYPIAESILRTREAGFDTFRDICDSTSRKTKFSTIYSNIHDLTTGDIWFFYGMDYHTYYKTTLKELLNKGSRSIFLYELFIDAPLVWVYQSYNRMGVDEGLKVLENFRISQDRKMEILRLLSSDLIFFNRDFRSYPFLDKFCRSQIIPDDFNQVLSSISLFCLGKKEEALLILQRNGTNNPNNAFALEIRNRMMGIPPEGANARFELKGFQDAQHVFVDGISTTPVYNFMANEDGKWIGHFRLPSAEYHYHFVVDGNILLDPENNDIVKDGAIEFNRIFIH